ncbi:MAG: maleylpyruvate isomerase family mycothiol-dependent enzyme [Actinobacteria bacterium]|nr:maleylpyruvate isomerase family mycothiol-dependent enzyme [Actinomycetota bacterium]
MTTLSALREECEALSGSLSELKASDFDRETRCTEWDVKQLLGHIYRDVDRINEVLASDEPAEASHDSATYFRYDIAKQSPGVAARAKEVAAGFATGQDLVAAWNELWPATLEAAAVASPVRVVATWGPTLQFDEYLRTRVLEVAVHRMDFEDAFGRKCWGSDQAVGIVDEILVDLLGKEPPHELDWDIIDFIETGTGRRALTEEEKGLLGPRATKKFPLLG